jgi:hypothetical protein
MANPQVSEMAYFRALIRKHVNVEVCPLPPESPSLEEAIKVQATLDPIPTKRVS